MKCKTHDQFRNKIYDYVTNVLRAVFQDTSTIALFIFARKCETRTDFSRETDGEVKTPMVKVVSGMQLSDEFGYEHELDRTFTIPNQRCKLLILLATIISSHLAYKY